MRVPDEREQDGRKRGASAAAQPKFRTARVLQRSKEALRAAALGLGGLAALAAHGLGGLAALAASSACASDAPRHGLSAFGDLKYAADFAHFEWVNPAAPKGGRLATIGTQALTSFDSFNPFILKGDPAQGLGFLFDALMTRAWDEPDAVYGLVAQSASLAADRTQVTFRMRPEARFADGSPVTAEDVVFSFGVLKEKGHPSFALALRDVAQAQASGPREVRFLFSGAATRDLPLVVATLPVLSKAYYTTHPFDQTSLEPPLGSGPYAIGDFKQGTFVSFRRRPDYWGRDLPVNRGRYNFDELRFEYYRDRTAELESLKAGAYDLREEFTSRDWVTAYDIPAVRDGRLVRLTLPDENPSGTQGFFLNTRRAKLADPRVRQALDLAFDFEWANKNLFYGLYRRTESFFENSPLKATGAPGAEELALLEPFRAKLAPGVFGEPYVPARSDGSGQDRNNLRAAAGLLSAAGFELRNARRTNPAGEPLELEFLITDPVSERIVAPYVRNLLALGIAATIRRIDPAQYERRVKAFDFDIVSQRYVMRLTPGVELRDLFGSEAARREGTANLAGIEDPVVDALVSKVTEATSRSELTSAIRALDRVLRAGHYWVPQWYSTAHRIVYWDKFGRPEIKPRYDRGIEHTWWWDAAKAAKLGLQ